MGLKYTPCFYNLSFEAVIRFAAVFYYPPLV
jgi:hypothetical protein